MTGPEQDSRIECVNEGNVWRVTIRNPYRRGALTREMYADLEGIALRAIDDPDLRAIVIAGTDGSFCAGTDVREFARFSDHGADGVDYERRLSKVFDALERVPVPVIGMVDGPAMGGGLALLLCCDLIVASDRAVFGAPIVQTLGNVLPLAVLSRLERLVGASVMRSMLLLAEKWSATDAALVGFIHRVTDPTRLQEAVQEVIDGIMLGAPISIRSIKALDRRLAAGCSDDEDILRRCYGSSDFREGLAAFIEKRLPSWTGQ